MLGIGLNQIFHIESVFFNGPDNGFLHSRVQLIQSLHRGKYFLEKFARINFCEGQVLSVISKRTNICEGQAVKPILLLEKFIIALFKINKMTIQ